MFYGKRVHMGNVISIELFRQVYKFKTDLDPALSSEAVKMLKEAVGRLQGGAPGSAMPLPERQIVLIMAALEIACDQIRLQQQSDGLLIKLKSRSDHLITKLNVKL